MRDDLVLPPTARQLAGAGLAWEPAIGDWAVVFGARHADEGAANLWLVTGIVPEQRPGGHGEPAVERKLRLVESMGRWAPITLEVRGCTWLPTGGQLRTWLRSRGYTVLTGESPTRALGTTAIDHFRCRATAPNGLPIEAEGLTEAEAVASVVLHLLSTPTAEGSRPPQW